MSEHVGKRSRIESRYESVGARAVPTPGKRTLTEALEPVQRKVAGTAAPGRAGAQDEAAVHAAAARGVATPTAQLPHLDTIQRAFGRHDIAGIQAHVGGDAATSAREMGAKAYATGDHVVLGSEADLHTAAHEAAHVVQQRGGVQLKGGVGEVGDAYERHADAVADLVVRGESAEVVLDGTPGGGLPGAQPTGMIQRGHLDSDSEGESDTESGLSHKHVAARMKKTPFSKCDYELISPWNRDWEDKANCHGYTVYGNCPFFVFGWDLLKALAEEGISDQVAVYVKDKVIAHSGRYKDGKLTHLLGHVGVVESGISGEEVTEYQKLFILPEDREALDKYLLQ
jgi:hypothetical protein